MGNLDGLLCRGLHYSHSHWVCGSFDPPHSPQNFLLFLKDCFFIFVLGRSSCDENAYFIWEKVRSSSRGSVSFAIYQDRTVIPPQLRRDQTDQINGKRRKSGCCPFLLFHWFVHLSDRNTIKSFL